MIAALPRLSRRFVLASITIAAAMAAAASWLGKAHDTLLFMIASFVDVGPMIGVGLIISAWVAASGVGHVTASLFRGRRSMIIIIIASAIGAVTPVCGVTVLPLMTGFLASGVPLAPIMAFWLSSPVTDPSLFTATWAVLGPSFAIGKTVAAFALGIFAGLATAAFATTDMVRMPLRSARHVEGRKACPPAGNGFTFRIWREPIRMRAFRAELLWMTKLVIACLSLAFAAEYLLRDLFPPDVLATYVGVQSPYAIPLAVTIGAPLYLDGYAALPLVRGMLDLGMSPGAALGFLVAGSAVSIWGVLAVVPVLRASTSALFVTLAVAGSLGVAYAFEALMMLCFGIVGSFVTL
jgi:uncharacterized membrane protein YraQ (UPF0718 family)